MINRPIVSTFIDEIKVIDVNGLDHITNIKLELATAFEILDIGLISFYPGLEVERN